MNCCCGGEEDEAKGDCVGWAAKGAKAWVANGYSWGSKTGCGAVLGATDEGMCGKNVLLIFSAASGSIPKPLCGSAAG